MGAGDPDELASSFPRYLARRVLVDELASGRLERDSDRLVRLRVGALEPALVLTLRAL